MLCENCGKNESTSIFLSPENNTIKYLCGNCYRKINNEIELEMLAIKETNQMEIQECCLNCGTSFNSFKTNGTFGCEQCYVIFKKYLEKNFLVRFKEQKYLGKKPNMYYVEKQIKDLEQMVEICVKNGNLQKATKYGLEIEKLKDQNYGKL